MSGRFCRMTNCFKYEVGNTQRCEEHLPEELKGATVVGPSVTNMKKLIMHRGKVWEAEQVQGDTYALSRYDNEETVMVNLPPIEMMHPSHTDMQEYVISKAEYESGVEPEPETGSFEGQLGQVLAEMGELLRKKNKDYGSSYDKTVEELGETVILIRIMDKFNRLKQLIKSGEPGEVEETIEETLSDLVGYGIIELVRRRRS